jgi:hypothetical protein
MKSVEDEHFGNKENNNISLSEYCLLLSSYCNIKQIPLHAVYVKNNHSAETLSMNIVKHRNKSETSDPA